MTDDDDIVDVEVEEIPSGSILREGEPATEPPAATTARKRLRPPKNRLDFALRLLIAIAAAALLFLGLHLFRNMAPERYADFRALFPAEWRFPPPAPDPTMPNKNLPEQG